MTLTTTTQVSEDSARVTLYATFRIELSGVKAADPRAMAEKADNEVPYYSMASAMRDVSRYIALADGMRITEVAYPEDVLHGALVRQGTDEVGTEFGYNLELQEDIEARERKRVSHEASMQFMTELMDSFESLGGLADMYGPDILVHLMYLSHAIGNVSHIDLPEGQLGNDILAVVAQLPKGDTWRTYIRENKE